MIKKTPYIFLYSLLFALGLHINSLAQSASGNNLCNQIQCVKIQNGYLKVLSSDNVTYLPYFVKAIGYQPMPIGRHPSDWGYASSDPRSSINNIYDDPAILDRDFALLQQMNANTIRIWNAANVPAASGEFPNKMTMNTLNAAQQYNIKVIPGFWVNPLTFDANNNISSTDNVGNVLTRQQIINNFVNFVNTFKGSPAILFWAIGNENNYQQPIMTAAQLTAWYSLVNSMAQAAHNAEGAYFHPVAIVNGEIALIGNTAYGSSDAQMPYLDIWGANIYRGSSFGTLFSDYAAQSSKPLWISEFGIDAFSTTSNPTIIAEINNWQLQMSNPSIIAQEGSANTTLQSNWDGGLWDEINNNSPTTIGGSVMEYSDEWWAPNEWMCTIANPTNDPNIQAENVISENYCMTTHSNFGSSFSAFPDDYNNPQWFGVMSISPNPIAGSPDIMSPRPIYNNFQTKWQTNPWANLSLNIAGSGTGNITSSSSIFGAGLNCNYLSASSSGQCSFVFPKNQSVTLTFTSSNNSKIANWGVGNCPASSASCTITPDTDVVLNVTIQAPVPASLSVAITSPSNLYYMVAGSNLTITANAQELGGNISNVAFYNGTTLLGEANSPVSGNQYAFTWNNVPSGFYSLTAVAEDSNGSSKVSSDVLVVSLPASPVVFISSPGNQSTFPTGSSISLNAFASENFNGTITKIAFYNGASLIGMASGGPNNFSYNWLNAPSGTYNITAVATDSVGTTSTSSSILLTVAPSGLNVAITSPKNLNYIVAGSNLTITANASENSGNISHLAFYNGTSLLGTSNSPTTPSGNQYSYTWNNVPAGFYSLTAIATDSSGASKTSSTVSVVSVAAAPVVFMTSPINQSAFLAGANVYLSAFSSENFSGTITKVSFYNGTSLIGISTIGPNNFNYTWSQVPAGTYTITAVATDSIGTQTISVPVNITVSNPIVNNVKNSANAIRNVIKSTQRVTFLRN